MFGIQLADLHLKFCDGVSLGLNIHLELTRKLLCDGELHLAHGGLLLISISLELSVLGDLDAELLVLIVVFNVKGVNIFLSLLTIVFSFLGLHCDSERGCFRFFLLKGN